MIWEDVVKNYFRARTARGAKLTNSGSKEQGNSNGADIESTWRVVKLQEEKFQEKQHPDTTVIVEGHTLYAFTRVNSKKYTPKLYVSNDFGETWTEVINHDFRAASSKLYAGTLSTGQKYAVFNYPMSDGTDGRGVLALAISSKDEKGLKFSKIFKICSR